MNGKEKDKDKKKDTENNNGLHSELGIASLRGEGYPNDGRPS